MNKGETIKTLYITLIILIILPQLSCCLLVKENQPYPQTPADAMACFLDAIIDDDYQSAALYILDEAAEIVHEMFFEFNDFRDILEMDDSFYETLDKCGLTFDDLYDLSPNELVAFILVVASNEFFDLSGYEIIAEEIDGDSAVVTVVTDTEVDIPMIKQDGFWKISFNF